MMDVVVHLSRHKGLKRALPQALAAGKPVVAFDCDGAAEVCHDGGKRIPASRPATGRGFAGPGCSDWRPIRRCGNGFGIRGQRMVREAFSVEGMVERLHELYVRLLGSLASGGDPAGHGRRPGIGRPGGPAGADWKWAMMFPLDAYLLAAGGGFLGSALSLPPLAVLVSADRVGG